MSEEKETTSAVKPGTNALMDPASVNHLWKLAVNLSKTDLVPKMYQGKPENCLIAVDYANRINMPVLAVMQNLAVINGKPGLEAKMIVSLINSSGLFTEKLQYEIEGKDARYDRDKNIPRDPSYRIRAFATFKHNGRTVYGPWVDWDMAIGEGWVKKDGSKWKTMPEIMFMYRASAFFQKTHCPELTMGMQTLEEMEDSPLDKQTLKESFLNKVRDVPQEPVIEAEEAPPNYEGEEMTEEEKEAINAAEAREYRISENQEDLFVKK